MNRLKQERKRLRISQDTLGRAANIPQSDLAQVELGNYVPPDAVLERLAAVLHIPVDELLKSARKEREPLERDSAGRYMAAER